MRSPLRWKLWTLMVVVAVAGMIFAGVTLCRRSIRYREISRECIFGHRGTESMIEAIDGLIRVDRMMVDVKDRVPSDLDETGRYADSPMTLEKYLQIRSKFFDLGEDFRKRASRYRRASYRPWELIRNVDNGTFRNEGVHRLDKLIYDLNYEESLYIKKYWLPGPIGTRP